MMQKTIYIASVGYSGSTLLDLLLGANASVTSLGEVYLLSRYAREAANCTCGVPVVECAFWQAVQERLREVTGRQDLQLADYPLTVEETIHRKVPTPNDVLLALGSRRLWKALAGHTALSRRYADASSNALRLFDVVCSLNGTSVIADSSKYAVPMKALYLADPERVRIVFLVRDGRGTSLSLARRHNMSFEEAAASWRRYNWNVQLMLRTIPQAHRIVVRYEDLCTDVQGTLDRIGDLIDRPGSLRQAPLVKENFHNIGGNPMRFRYDEVDVRLDEKWRRELGRAELQLFDRIAGDMNGRFGYT
jgi:hypothetical protein